MLSITMTSKEKVLDHYTYRFIIKSYILGLVLHSKIQCTLYYAHKRLASKNDVKFQSHNFWPTGFYWRHVKLFILQKNLATALNTSTILMMKIRSNLTNMK